MVRVNFEGGKAFKVWSNCQVPFRLITVLPPMEEALARSEMHRNNKMNNFFMVA
jgi:hypothetical protein